MSMSAKPVPLISRTKSSVEAVDAACGKTTTEVIFGAACESAGLGVIKVKKIKRQIALTLLDAGRRTANKDKGASF